MAAATLVCPPDRHIPVETTELLTGILANLPANQQGKFSKIMNILDRSTRNDFAGVRRMIIHLSGVFTAAAAKRAPALRKGKVFGEEELDDMEVSFINEFMAMMEASHYRMVDQQIWDIAQSETFMFTLPVRVEWDDVDNVMLKKFWATRPPATTLCLPEISDRVLMFYRGLDVAREKGTFISEKINILLDMLIISQACRLFENLKSLFVGRKSNHGSSASAEGSASAFSSNKADTTHRAAKYVERKTLRRIYPTVKSLVVGFLETVELVEPRFKEVVVLYREKVEKPAAPKGETNGAAEKEEPLCFSRNMHIKRFKDIPLADVEMVLPDKSILIDNTTLMTIIGTMVAAVVAGVMGLFVARADGGIEVAELSKILGVVGLIGGRAATMYTRIQTTKQMISDKMNRALYERSMDSQEGLLLALLEEMTDQLMKQAMVAYYCLLRQRYSMVQRSKVDEMAEHFLDDNFDCRIDFAVDHALRKLTKEGITATHGDQACALDLDVAIRTLSDKQESQAPYSISNEDAESTDDSFVAAQSDVLSSGSEEHPVVPRASNKSRVLRALRGPSWTFKRRNSSTNPVFDTPISEDGSPSAASSGNTSSRKKTSGVSFHKELANGSGGVTVVPMQTGSAKSGKRGLVPKSKLFKRVFNSPFDS